MVVIDSMAVVRALWADPKPKARVAVLPASSAGWARFCINEAVSLRAYAAGFALIEGPDGAEWLAKGFEAILDWAVHNPVTSTPILPVWPTEGT